MDMDRLIERAGSDRPVLIAGPTASGKSALALAIARTGGGVVVNADALQVYGRWRILTARPDAVDIAQAPHALYGHVGAAQDYSVGHWLREVAALLAQRARPIIVGGTGLYFSALTEGLADIPATPKSVRQDADARIAIAGLDALLADLDPATTARIDIRNPARVQRAWEVQHATGRGLAAWQDDTPPPILPLPDCLALRVDAPPALLTPRIERRFDVMLDQGALAEVRANLADFDFTRPADRAIGAPELVAHLRGQMSLGDARDAAIVATRQYAKRQRTWFAGRMRDWRGVPMPAP